MGATPTKWPSGTTAVGDRTSIGVGAVGAKSAGRENDGVVEMSRERFEELVSEALDRLPAEIADIVDNCVVLVEDDPPPDDPDLLGLYDGTPLTERGGDYVMRLPDRITIYRNPILAMCEDEEHVVEEVDITVVHEIAHHFGIDDDRLHDLGYA
jgi:predicted Zn-dependent protease with MMP-like domain